MAILSLVAGGCGADGFAAERQRLREYVPEATAVRCSGTPSEAVDCEGRLGRVKIHCEFRYEGRRGNQAYSGTENCWSDEPLGGELDRERRAVERGQRALDRA